MKNKNEEHLELGEIVAAEYEYIAQTAEQAHEDRARISTFYLVSVGSLFGAIWGTSATTELFTLLLFAILFLFLSIFSLLTIQQLVSLRLAWIESAKAMGQIKEFLIQENSRLATAFRWTKDSIPGSYKPKSISYYLAIQVAMIGAITFGAMVIYVILAITAGTNALAHEVYVSIPHLLLAMFGSVIFFIVQMTVYKKGLINN